MVKRLGSVSDDEPLPKRRRLEKPDSANGSEKTFNLRLLPQEMQDKIYLAATSYDGDPAAFVEALVNIGQVDRQFQAKVAHDYRRNPSLEEVVSTVQYAQKKIGRLVSEVDLPPDHKAAYLLPILPKSRREEVVAALFAQKLSDIPVGVGASLVANVAYLDPARKPELAEYALLHAGNESLHFNPLLEAARNIEHFTPVDAKSFLAAALSKPDTRCRAEIFAALSKKADLLDEGDQVRLAMAMGDPRGPADCLVIHARSLEKLGPASAIVVVNQVCQLPDEHWRKWTAMAVLARKFECLGEPEQKLVSSCVIPQLERGVALPPDGSPDFVLFSKVEAGHQLSLHKAKLSHAQRQDLEAFIEDVVQAPIDEKLPLKAILLTHLEDQRAEFVKNSSNSENHDVRSSIFVGLHFRVGDMSRAETEEYASHMHRERTTPDCLDLMKDAIIEHFDKFTAESRVGLFFDSLDSMSDMGGNARLDFFEEVAGKEALLPGWSVNGISDSLEASVNCLRLDTQPREWEKDRAIKHARLAASSVANWAHHQMRTISREREIDNVPGDHIQRSDARDAKSLISRNYNQRTRQVGREP